jgi:voltage-gated potassium channel
MRSRLRELYFSHRFAIMFYSILLVILLGPLLPMLGLDRRIGQLVIAVNLASVTAGLTVGAIRRTVVVLVVAGIAIAGLRDSILTAHGLSPALMLWSILSWIGAFTVVRFALFSGEVRGEHMYAALNAYLIAGLYMGVIYHAINDTVPGSFLVLGVPGTEANFNLGHAIYFSFITLATLGYGDVVPTSDVTRSLAVVEAIVGQMYVAVLIARLVGSFGAHRGS